MSTTTKERKPLFSEEEIMYPPDFGLSLTVNEVRFFYEAARAKDTALIQQLVDALALIGTSNEHSGHVCEAIAHSPTIYHESYDPCPGIRRINDALAAAKEQGFTPSHP